MTELRQAPSANVSVALRAAAFANGWTRWYTSRVGDDAGSRRRGEIESDLWEQLADSRARGAAPGGVAAAISWRVVAGMPADLAWMRHQRAIARGGSNRETESMMSAVTRQVGRWWWVVLALGIAAAYVAMAAGNLAEPGMPYMEGTAFAFACAALIVAGAVVRFKWPVVGGLLVVAGAGPAVLLWWAPVIAVIGGLVLLGAVIDLVIVPAVQRRITRAGAAARVLAIVGVLVGMVAPLALGVPGLLVTALVAVALVVAAVLRRRQSTLTAANDTV